MPNEHPKQERFEVPLSMAYADPPYLGCCGLYDHYHGPEAKCWDDLQTHRDLIKRLQFDFRDGWALSVSSVSLRSILPLCPSDVRVAAWVKPFASFKPNVNPGYTWEPVIFRGGRAYDRYDPTIKDHRFEDPAHRESIQIKKGLIGAKPPGFAQFVFQLLGLAVWDHFSDLYPGTGGIGRAWTDLREEAMRIRGEGLEA